MCRLTQQHDPRVADAFEQGVILRGVARQSAGPVTNDGHGIAWPWRRIRAALRRDGQESGHFFVRRLRKLLVPQADRVERLGRRHAHHLVDQPAQMLASLPRTDRDRHDDSCRRLLPERDDRRLHRRTGREPIVDENHGPIANGRRTPPGTIQHIAPFEFQTFPDGNLLDERTRNAEILDQIGAEHLDAAGGDRAHGEFRMTRDAELTHEIHVQRGVQSGRDLIGDGDSTSRQTQHDDIRPPCERRQSSRQLTTSIGTIVELHEPAPFYSTPASCGVSRLDSGTSVNVASVSSSVPATDTAFSSAIRTTFVGSMMPASTRST